MQEISCTELKAGPAGPVCSEHGQVILVMNCLEGAPPVKEELTEGQEWFIAGALSVQLVILLLIFARLARHFGEYSWRERSLENLGWFLIGALLVQWCLLMSI